MRATGRTHRPAPIPHPEMEIRHGILLRIQTLHNTETTALPALELKYLATLLDRIRRHQTGISASARPSNKTRIVCHRTCSPCAPICAARRCSTCSEQISRRVRQSAASQSQSIRFDQAHGHRFTHHLGIGIKMGQQSVLVMHLEFSMRLLISLLGNRWEKPKKNYG